MKDLIIIPSNKEMIYNSLEYVSGYILGIKDLSVNLSFILEDYSLIDEVKKEEKKVYISLNKNMQNDDLKLLEETLISLSKLNIDGIFFYDLAVLNIVKRLNLKIDLIWNQEHFATNFYTANYYYDNGVSSMHVSSDITLEEIKEIKNNYKGDLFISIFGYLPMFNSFRHLVNNYLDTFGIKKNKELYYMEEKGKYYPIIDDQYGTTVYSENILNGLNEYNLLKNNNISFILDSFLISNEKFIEVLKIFNLESEDKFIEELFPNVDKGFFYKETIYKVKK